MLDPPAPRGHTIRPQPPLATPPRPVATPPRSVATRPRSRYRGPTPSPSRAAAVSVSRVWSEAASPP